MTTTPQLQHRQPSHALALTSLIGLLLVAPAMSQAQQSQAAPKTQFSEIGIAKHGTHSASVGLTWPSHWQPSHPGLSLHWDAYLSHWQAPNRAQPDSHEGLTQIAIVPVLRWRLDGGRSAWYAEGGIGATYLDSLYETPQKRFSTRWNFADHLALGLNFGAKRQHELAVRYQHISNANIKQPNPGQDFLQLRYSRAFSF